MPTDTCNGYFTYMYVQLLKMWGDGTQKQSWIDLRRREGASRRPYSTLSARWFFQISKVHVSLRNLYAFVSRNFVLRAKVCLFDVIKLLCFAIHCLCNWIPLKETERHKCRTCFGKSIRSYLQLCYNVV